MVHMEKYANFKKLQVLDNIQIDHTAYLQMCIFSRIDTFQDNLDKKFATRYNPTLLYEIFQQLDKFEYSSPNMSYFINDIYFSG